MKLLVVIVNFRTADLTLEGLTHLLPDMQGLDAAVTVVDNDSGDGSYEKLCAEVEARGWGDRVAVVPSGSNGGFGFGNNVAIRRALAQPEPPDVVFLHNPDARVRPGALRTMLEFLDAHPEVGVAGTRIHDPGAGTHTSAFRFPSALSELEGGLRLGPVTRLLRKHSVWADAPDHTAEVDWVSGASAFFRREVFETVGLFDESFFLYFEETDLCRRAREAGWKVWYVHEAVVEHEEGAATGITNKRKRVPQFWLDSRRYYFLKAKGRRGLLLADAAWVAAHSLWRVRRAVQRLPDPDPPQLLEDFVRHSLGLPRKD